MPHWHPIDEYRVIRRVNQPRNQTDERGLSAPRPADKRDRIALLDLQIDVLQYRLSVISESQVAKLNLSFDRRPFIGLGRISYRRLRFKYRVEPLQRRRAALVQ